MHQFDGKKARRLQRCHNMYALALDMSLSSILFYLHPSTNGRFDYLPHLSSQFDYLLASNQILEKSVENHKLPKA
jgi:hypothetical protein